MVSERSSTAMEIGAGPVVNSSTVSTSKFTLIAFTHSLSVKLNNINFLIWKQQVLSTIKGYRFQRFVFYSQIPSKFKENDTEISQEFLEWEQQDQLLLSWLLSSISSDLLPRLVGCESSYQIWSKLEQLFASQTRAKINQFKNQLHNIKKGSLSINEYLSKIKVCVDSLNSVGYLLNEKDHVDIILEGLPIEYDAFTTSVNTRIDDFSVSEIEALLMAQEAKIEKNNKLLDSSPSANVTVFGNTASGGSQQHLSHSQSQFGNNSPYGRGYDPSYGRGYGSNNRGIGRRGRFNGGYRGGRGPRQNGNKLQCQLCGKIGHTVIKCYYRFDQSFQGHARPINSNSHGSVVLNNSKSNFPLSSGSSVFYSHTPTFPQMSDVNSSVSCHSDTRWYPDSGASSHVTPIHSNLQMSTPFDGSEKVHIGNGSGLSIQNIGQSSFRSSFTSKPLLLNQLLHVPSITKNLLSVSKFSKDNNVYFVFFPDECFVKDQTTNQTLLAGKVNQGLYVFDFSQASLTQHSFQSVSRSSSSQTSVSHSSPVHSPSCNTVVCCNCSNNTKVFDLWHNRLGHPAFKTVKHVMSICNVPNINKVSPPFCSSCCLGKIHKFPFLPSHTVCTSPLQLIHSDLWGPAPTTSSNGYHYYINFVDAFSKYTWIYMLRNKSEALQTFINFKSLVELQCNSKIKAVQSDWGVSTDPFKPIFKSMVLFTAFLALILKHKMV